MSVLGWFSRNIAYPIWDLRDRSQRLSEFRRLNQSQWNATEEISRYQLGRLQKIMEHSYGSVPFYRSRWTRSPIKYPLQSIGDLGDYPILCKQEVREYQDELISEAFNKADLVSAKTGGSTGFALELFFDKTCQEFRNAAAMWVDGWAGWKPGSLMAALWGTPPVPKTIKERIRNVLHDRVFYLDTMSLNAETMTDFLAEINRRKPDTMFGHAHSLYELALFVEKENFSHSHSLKGIVATSMMLLPSQRKVIERAFKCVVTNRYGCEEVGLIACECNEHRGMHINSEHLIVEVIDDAGRQCKAGKEGRIIVTDLNNYGMPLIRYEVGDLGVLSDRECNCGRKSPLLADLVGRTADYLIRKDGSKISGISLVEKTLTLISGIEQMQIIQETTSRFLVRVVADNCWTEASKKQLITVVDESFGYPCDVAIDLVEQLEKTGRGKYRFALTHVDH